MAPRLPLGLGKDLAWNLDNLTGVVPAGTSRKPPDTPTGILSRVVQQGVLATTVGALSAVLKEDLQKSCPCPGNTSPLLPLRGAWGQSPQLSEWRSKRSLTLPPERVFLGSALSTVKGVQKPRTPPSLEKALAHRGQKKVLCCFYSPFRALKALLFAV